VKPTHGLIIGKFYPPHAGHHLLIRAAAASCARVTVIVMAASHESIPLEARVRWLREVHQADAGVSVTGIVDDVPIDYQDDGIWRQHVALMREALQGVDAPPVSAVFTSEPYGEELARRFNAIAVTLDFARQLAPVSATAVRADVVGQWQHLAEPVRGALALKVVVLGAESTGTTTLSLALAEQLRGRGAAHGLTRCVAEYGREYSMHKWAAAISAAGLRGGERPHFDQLQWTPAEFEHIAAIQRDRTHQAARIGGPVLICDTDPFATLLWQERYTGSTTPEVEHIAESGLADLYLLTTHVGVPFEQDGLRDGEHLRASMTRRFEQRLRDAGQRFVVLEGDREVRLQQAIAGVDELLAHAWKFQAPLG
jgi:HTH-type transcriptional regulator, transcriptional repressor of NAD biosynthesis genes